MNKNFVRILISISFIISIYFLDLFIFRKNYHKIKKIQELVLQYENKLKQLKDKKDAEEKVKLEEEEKEKLESYRKQIDEEIIRIDKHIASSPYDPSDIKQIQWKLDMLADFYKIIKENDDSKDDKIREKIGILKKKILQFQLREFPILRISLSKIIGSKLWGNNIKVYTYGDGSRNIRFVGGAFLNNSNKTTVWVDYMDILERFRFKRADFIPIEGYDLDYTYWNIEKYQTDDKPIDKALKTYYFK